MTDRWLSPFFGLALALTLSCAMWFALSKVALMALRWMLPA